MVEQKTKYAIQQYYNGLKTPVFLCMDRDIVWYNIAADELIKDTNFRNCIMQISSPSEGEEVQYVTCGGLQHKLLIRPCDEDFFVEVIEIRNLKSVVFAYEVIGGIESMENTVRKSAHQIFQSIASLSDIFEQLDQHNVLEHLDNISDGTYGILRAANLYYEYNLLLKNKLELEVVDIFNEVEALCSSVKSIMGKSTTSFTWDIPEKKLFCNVDMHKLSFALFHLICNSYCFTSSKNEIKLIMNNLKDEYVQIQLVDKGCGVSSENLDKIFEPFYSYNPLTGDIAGCGLGLTYVNELICKLGGTLSFNSSENKTVVSIMIPVQFVSESMDLSSDIVKYGVGKYDSMVSTMITLGNNSKH